MATKEGQRAILRPGVPAPEALEEAHMTSLLDEIGLEPARGGHRGARQGRGGYEGIVQRVDEQRGAADARQELRAARARPVIPLIGKAVERRGDEAIVLGERLGPVGRGQVEKVPVEMGLQAELGLHGGKEIRGVQAAVEAAIEHRGAGGEIEWRRDGYRRRHRRRNPLPELAQPLEEDVAPERNAHEAQGRLRIAREQKADHELEVFRVARVVEATRAIHLPAAGAEVDDQATPAHLLEAAEQPHDIVRACRAFEAVEHDDERCAGLAPGQPVEIEEVAVRRLDPLTPERRSPKAPQEGSPQGLEMLASVPPRRMIGGGSDHVAAGASTRPRASRPPQSLTPPALVRRRLLLTLEEELDDVGDDLPRPLVQLSLGEVRDGMRQSEEFVVRQPPALGHGMTRGLENIGDDRHGGNAELLEKDSVEHTARRAGPSVADAGDDAVRLAARLVEDLLVGGHAGVVLAPHGVLGGAVLALEDLADPDEELVGVELRVLHEADALALEGVRARHVRQRLLACLYGGVEDLETCHHALLSRMSFVTL